MVPEAVAGLWLAGSVVMACATGMAGSRGMLSRTFYEGRHFEGYALVAVIGGILDYSGFLAFLLPMVLRSSVRSAGWQTAKPAR